MNYALDFSQSEREKYCERAIIYFNNLLQDLIFFFRSCRGQHVSLIVRFPSHGRQGDDFEIWSHANESIASVRRQILSRYVRIL